MQAMNGDKLKVKLNAELLPFPFLCKIHVQFYTTFLKHIREFSKPNSSMPSFALTYVIFISHSVVNNN